MKRLRWRGREAKFGEGGGGDWDCLESGVGRYVKPGLIGNVCREKGGVQVLEDG